MKKLIVTGDDFGHSVSINDAIIKSFAKGVLTTTSLMITAPAANHAIENAKKYPRLNVGLHLVLSNGKAKSAASSIPKLVNNSGQFHNNKFYSGLIFFFSLQGRAQLKKEIRAQFEAYKETGLKLDHVNAHNHMHLHPTVFNLIIKIGHDYGLTAMRIPNEPPLKSIIDNRKQFIIRYLRWVFFGLFTTSMKKKCIKNDIKFNNVIYGLHDSGSMNIEKLIRIISHISDGITEIYTHPTTSCNHNSDMQSNKDRLVDEYKALIHARTKRTIDKFNIKLCGFNS